MFIRTSLSEPGKYLRRKRKAALKLYLQLSYILMQLVLGYFSSTWFLQTKTKEWHSFSLKHLNMNKIMIVSIKQDIKREILTPDKEKPYFFLIWSTAPVFSSFTSSLIFFSFLTFICFILPANDTVHVAAFKDFPETCSLKISLLPIPWMGSSVHLH